MVLHATPRRKVAYAQLEHPQRPSRRAVLTSVGLPMLLAPTQAAWAGEGRLSIDEVESRLKRCFEEGQYYVSGKLDRGIFEPDCFFKDPTVSVKGAPSQVTTRLRRSSCTSSNSLECSLRR